MSKDKSLEQEIDNQIIDIVMRAASYKENNDMSIIASGDLNKYFLPEQREKLLTLLNTHCQKRDEQTYIEAVAVGMARAKTAVTIMMNTGKTSMNDLRQGIDNEIEVWNRIMAEGDQLKQTSIKEREDV